MYKFKLALLLLLFNNGFAQNWLQSQRAERQFKEAVSSYNEGRFAIAEDLSSAIIDSDFESFNEKTLLLLLKSQIALNKSSEAKQTAKSFSQNTPLVHFYHISWKVWVIYM